ncbi:MAG: inositol monophosphatase, partial [Clostridiales bacterium]|nr:inositol monophosphatase [Clostridiales bacterium]
NRVIELVKKAGEMLIEPKEYKIYQKEGHGNFVTQMDEKMQAHLVSELQKQYPQVGIIAEEKENQKMTQGAYFVIDPIDGTMNFMRQRRDSAISIAYIEEKQPVWGVIYNPFQKLLWEAEKGKGAFENGEPIHVADTPFSAAVTVFGTAVYYEELLAKSMYLAYRFIQETADLRRKGAASLDFCDIARGSGDIFFELSLAPWDFAAGAIILQEAGGIATQVDGSPLRFDQTCSLLAATPACYPRALEIAKEKMPESWTLAK